MNQELVSVVITTKNEEKNIVNCVNSIKNQTYKNIEIIVVDNKSTDNTKKLAQDLGCKVFDKGPERSAQRNYGIIDSAKGSYAMYVDADMILAPSIIENCLNNLKQTNAVALHIPEVVLGKNFFSQVRRFERSFYDGTVVDGARFFNKKIFEKIKGFDEGMSGPEDWDLDKKLKREGNIALLKAKSNKFVLKDMEFLKERGVNPDSHGSVIFHNESEFNLKQYLKKKSYYAGSFDVYINKWGKNDSDIKKQLGLPYRFFGVYLENGKWKKLILNPHLTFGMYFLRFLVGLTFISRKRA